MPSRLPEPAPVLAGYTVVRPLGSGGFADVFLYEQSMPRRKVAVKVLLPGVADADMRRMFLAEATLMAQLSAHPDVLTVYEANVAADGRPYLVMEYCPDSYGRRYRDERLPISEVLQIAIAVGSVLETAHRDGFLHRDVKPSNILRTSYGKPVLADFGIASTLAVDARQDARGMSVPWSAPEVIHGTTHGTVQSEVYAFAATIYGLFAGRSPFEVPGKDNSLETLERRILGRATATPMGRSDVPPTLETALLKALSKNPADRQPTVLAVLRSLQLAETELGLRPSTLLLPSERVLDASSLVTPDVAVSDVAGSDAAAARRPRSRSGPSSRSAGTSTGSASRRSRSHTLVEVSASDATGVRHAAGLGSERARTRDGGGPKSRRPLAIGSSILAVLVVATLVVLFAVRSTDGAGIPQVGTISANSTSDSVQFTWNDPGVHTGDSYLVRVDGNTGTTQSSTTITLDKAKLRGQACVTVTVVHDGRNGAPSNSTCAGG